MKLRREKPVDADVIDLTDGAHAWWAERDDLVTAAPSFKRAAAPPPPPPPSASTWSPEGLFRWASGRPHDPLNEIEPHAILGLEVGAPWEDVERARRDMAKAHHPDLAATAGPVEIDLRQRRMRAVNIAYEDIKLWRQRHRLD
jgi:DnaJ-domain-containing protein 1